MSRFGLGFVSSGGGAGGWSTTDIGDFTGDGVDGGTFSLENTVFTLLGPSSSSVNSFIYSDKSINSGKYYGEIRLDTTVSGAPGIIISAGSGASATLSSPYPITGTGVINIDSVSISEGPDTVIVFVAIDADNNLGWTKRNTDTDWNSDPSADPATGAGGSNLALNSPENGVVSSAPYYLLGSYSDPAVSGDTLTIYEDSADFLGTIPSGFSPWGNAP